MRTQVLYYQVFTAIIWASVPFSSQNTKCSLVSTRGGPVVSGREKKQIVIVQHIIL